MQFPYAALAPEYTALLGAMVITRRREIADRAAVILARANKEDFAAVLAATGVPKLWAIASFERESSSDYSTSPAQGDPWNKVSTHVPRGRGPYPNFAAAAIDAYRIDGLDKVGAKNWTWARACYEAELFNGFGPREHGRHSGYLWSWSSIYNGGKYVADGVWSAGANDIQCGMVPMMAMLLELDRTLALADAMPAGPAAAPAGVDGGDMGVPALQAALNKLALPGTPLVVDGSYGRATKRVVAEFQQLHGLAVDGIAGPETEAALRGLA